MIRSALLMIVLASVMPTVFADRVDQSWLPEERRVPGGVALVDISAHYQPGVDVLFNGNPVKIARRGNAVIAIVGIPLATSESKVTLLIEQVESVRPRPPVHIPIALGAGNYPVERLTIADSNKVSPDEESMRRIRTETGLIKKYLRNWQSQIIAPGVMALPANGRLSSTFGRRRIINDQPRRPHSGLDIAAATGTPVYAPAPGIISGSGDFFFNGNSLFVDHGEGLVSMFCHLNELLVQPGDEVEKGQLIARVGATGRVTGPHLHWSLSLNDARVDPLLFIENNLSSED